MKNVLQIILVALVLVSSVVLSHNTALAFVPLTNNNLMSVSHPAPVVTKENLSGAPSIPLEGGSVFLIERNAFGDVRVWKFSVDDAYWWVTNKGIIWGTNSNGNFPQAGTNEDAYQVYLSL